jgi:hypothetical protein
MARVRRRGGGPTAPSTFRETRGRERPSARGSTPRWPRARLTLDADGQHDPACAPRLLAALADADVVIGTRTRRGSTMPLRRRVSNAISAAAISVCAGQWLTDCQSGYRALRASMLSRVAPLGDRYEYETDFLIQAARMGLTIACVSVPTIYGAPSHFRELRDAARVVGTICRRLPLAMCAPTSAPAK